MYNVLIELIEAALLSESEAIIFPNKNKLTSIGPIVVPRELMLTAKFNLFEPVAGLPKFRTNGFADVCCSENPKAIIKKAPRINMKEPELTAGIMVKAPIIEISKP
jgi:hypothetical protein